MAPPVKPEKQLTIGLLSDTHDRMDMIYRALDCFKEAGTNLIIHAGDIVSPFALKPFLQDWCPFVGIFGNNEGEKAGLSRLMANRGILQEGPLHWRFHDYLFFITHIPCEFDSIAASGTYTAIIYGHTHRIDVRYGKTLIVNPGECCGWVEDRATIAILELPSRSVRIIDL